jgi:hypothetical protein
MPVAASGALVSPVFPQEKLGLARSDSGNYGPTEETAGTPEPCPLVLARL